MTTTTGVSGTSATSATTTTTDVAGTTAGSTTSGTVTTTGTSAAATVPAGAPPAPRVLSESADRGLAGTGAAPLWTAVGGLVALLGGALLLLFSRRRRA